MSIRVGRRIYNKDGTYKDPSFPGFIPVVCMTPSTKYGSLSPYSLKDSKGRILENVWQFSKVYPRVPAVKERYPRTARVIWEHPSETHVVDGKLTAEYWAWREKGQNAPHPIRYPVSYHYRSTCIGALLDGETDMGKKAPQFKELKQMLNFGVKLLIIEVDGPHQESLGYYKHKYNVADDFIQDHTVLINDYSLDILLRDSKHPFGHGYCLAKALQI